MQLWLIPFFPLAGAAINGLFGRRLPRSLQTLVAVVSVLLSLGWVAKTLLALGSLEQGYTEHYFDWISSSAFTAGFDFSIDRLTAIMLLVVTGIGSLIHLYATGYMSHEEGYHRFFAYLNLFMFFMLILVLASNFLLLFVGWEGVGLCSYLLIGFYFKKKSAGDAGKKAFIINRVGDFGFALAMFLIVNQFKTLDFATVFAAAAAMPVEQQAGLLTAITLLLVVGAAGKSAQIPLFTWLPDAMEGPTPVSALIHAATMVTAGVYLCARSAVLFQHAPITMNFIALLGLTTAFVAATIGLVQNDIKKVYAYSTVSQLGFMFLAVGSGAFSAAIYHVVTHAFFKALLFLGAGSVIHACEGEQDMRQMGGLAKKIPITFWTLLAGAVAIAGVPFTSGYFSKDEILLAAHHHAPWMYWAGVFTAGLTAFYVFRSIFLTFFGTYKGTAHPHESPLVMWAPLAVLAVLSLAGGYLFPIPHFLETLFPLAEAGHDSMLVMIASGAGLAGIAAAYVVYVASPGLADSLAESFSGIYKLLDGKYWFDETYDLLIVRPYQRFSKAVLWKGFDDGVLEDGFVGGAALGSNSLGNLLRLLQTGVVRNYAAWAMLGVLALLAAATVMGGAR